MHGFADMPFHVMSAHVAAADISLTKDAVKAIRVSTHFADIRIHFRPVDGSASSLVSSGYPDSILERGLQLFARALQFTESDRALEKLAKG